MNIDELIYLQNPWLRDVAYLPWEDRFEKRDLFDNLIKDTTNTRQIISLVGLRRVGKSTLLKQVIGQLLKTKDIPRENIFYFSFDQPTVAYDSQTLEKVLNFYLKEIVHRDVHKLESKQYLFFDEIQLIPSWPVILKRFYDLSHQLKFVVSGSASLFVKDKSKESLAGRIFEKYLPPLSFSEYQKLTGGNTDQTAYLDFGQFPELLGLPEKEKKIEYLQEGIIGKVIEHDIPQMYGIRKQVDFERLFWSLLPNTGQIVESAKLMADLGLKKATLFKYLSVLEKSLLVNKVLNLSGSFRSEKRLLRKLYPVSANFLSLIPQPTSPGFKAETYVASVLKGLKKEVYLFRLREREVDFLLPDKKLAIEVKYQEKIHAQDYQFLEKFVNSKGYKGIVVSKNYKDLDSHSRLVFVPLSEFDTFMS